jgi:hypothetical protein
MTNLISQYQVKVELHDQNCTQKLFTIYRVDYLKNSMEYWGVSKENINKVMKQIEADKKNKAIIDKKFAYAKYQGLPLGIEVDYTIIVQHVKPFTKTYKNFDKAFQKANELGVPMVELGSSEDCVYLVTQTQSVFDRVAIYDCKGRHAHMTNVVNYNRIPKVNYLDWQVPEHLR